MAEIGHIGKEKRNQQQGFMYRGIDDVMNALQPALVKHNVSIVPEVLEHTREERTTAKGGNLIYSICRVKFSFYADDGSSVSAIVVGEGMDSGDKATNKAMSVAFKYACFQTFCIPTEEMQDPDAETHEPSKPAPKQQEKAKDGALTAEQIKELKLAAGGDVELLKRAFSQNGYKSSADAPSTALNALLHSIQQELKLPWE